MKATQGEPFHVGCGERTSRRIGDRVVEMHAPGVWQGPARWVIPKQLYFVCPTHGAVAWDETCYSVEAVRGPRR